MSAHQLLHSAVCRLFQLSPFQELREIHATGREGAAFGSEVATLFSITGEQNSRKVEGPWESRKRLGRERCCWQDWEPHCSSPPRCAPSKTWIQPILTSTPARPAPST